MKKGIIVLLVAVLAAGFAFAATMTGNASITGSYDLGTTEWGLKNGQKGSTAFSFELASDKADFGSVGEGDLYAEIAASFSVALKVETSPKKWIDGGVEDGWYQINTNNLTGTSGTAVVYSGKWYANITKANIIYKDITIGILNAGGGYDYAKTYYAEVSDASKHTYKKESNVKMGEKLVNGFTVKYSDMLKVGFGATGKAADGTYKIFGQGEFTGIENLKVAGYAYLSDSDKHAGAAASYAFSTDELSASAAVDFKYDNDKAAVEAAASASYANYGVDAYFYTPDTFETNRLDAQATATFEDCVVTDAYVESRNIISNAAQYIEAGVGFDEGIVVTGAYGWVDLATKVFGAGATAAIDELSFGVDYATDFDFAAQEVSVNAKYAAEKFTAKASAYFMTTIGTADSSQFYITGSVESDAVISGATLSLSYGAGVDASGDARKMNFLADQAVAQDFGKITASCTIKF